ncbi:PREDICTED: neuropeptide SIFamide [Nicrophorus vespilloides]|uniref:Neuropeptide SIFamide n=1 Tax=Nicrophorus vespilloides TaxID=110193 RepID=A0ABM1M4U0_NICVS|nr:PREDICTED: neuropeptide SIFamide [Nicrophorus vespilloides]
MEAKFAKLFVFVFLALTMGNLFLDVEATYRKPPFNGSIFGKRGNIEYDSAGKALSAMCEIASEACQAWFPLQEK